MKGKDVTVEQMESNHIWRWKNRRYMGAGKKKQGGPIPEEVYKILAAPAYAVTSPEHDNGPWSEAKVKVPDYVNIIADLPPGQGVPLHIHARTWEIFMAIQGAITFEWGDDNEYSTVIEPFDLIAIPPGVNRRFENRTGEQAYMLVLISGGTHDMNDLIYSYKVGEKIRDEFGEEALGHVQKVGFRFLAGLEDAAE
jgi:mannose-6-phosphate isomerase-like protein (cupin superfamily)